MYEIEVFGMASNSVVQKIIIQEVDLIKNLMDFLREKGLPIASSCLGKMQCKKCVINGYLMSCSVSVKEYLRISSQPLDARSVSNKFLLTVDYL